jgi:hypothetical protein
MRMGWSVMRRGSAFVARCLPGRFEVGERTRLPRGSSYSGDGPLD